MVSTAGTIRKCVKDDTIGVIAIARHFTNHVSTQAPISGASHPPMSTGGGVCIFPGLGRNPRRNHPTVADTGTPRVGHRSVSFAALQSSFSAGLICGMSRGATGVMLTAMSPLGALAVGKCRLPSAVAKRRSHLRRPCEVANLDLGMSDLARLEGVVTAMTAIIRKPREDHWGSDSSQGRASDGREIIYHRLPSKGA